MIHLAVQHCKELKMGKVCILTDSKWAKYKPTLNFVHLEEIPDAKRNKIYSLSVDSRS